MSKYEEALKQGLTDDDIVQTFEPKMSTALTQLGEADTRVFLSTQMGLPDHLVDRLLGKQPPAKVSEDLSPEAKAAPVMSSQPTPEPSILESIGNTVKGAGKDIVNTVTSLLQPSAEQGAGAVVGAAGEAVRASEKTMDYLTGTPTATLKEAGMGNVEATLGQTMQKFSNDMDQKWQKEYGKTPNAPKLITDVAIGLGLPAATTLKVVTPLKSLGNLLNPQNIQSVITSVLVTDAQLRRDDVPHAEAWAGGFGALQGVIPVLKSAWDYRAIKKGEQYLDEILRLKPEDYTRELKAISGSIDLSGMSEFEKKVLVAGKVHPQAAAALEKVVLSNDKHASAVYQQLVGKTQSTENITQASVDNLGMTIRDTKDQIKSQYGAMSTKIANATGDMAFDIPEVKLAIKGVEDKIEANLLGRDKAIAVLNKLKNSTPTTYNDLAELASSLGKQYRKLPDGHEVKELFDSVYKKIRNSIETQVGKYASEEGKQVISATIKGQNESYAFLKQELEKEGLFKSTLFKNMTPTQMNAQLIKSVTSTTNPELTQKFLDILDRVKQTTNPELVEQSILQQIIQGSKTKVSDAGTELIDFSKLSTTLDNLPEGLITSPQAKLVMESLQDIASFSKYDLGLAKKITQFGGVEAEHLAGKVSSTLGFSLKLKTMQFLAQAGLSQVNSASAYAVAVAKVLNKERDLPIVIGQFKNAFGYNLPKDDLSQLNKYLAQMTDLYNESTKVRNATLVQRALSNSEGTYYRRLSDLYSEGELKDMFNIKNSVRGVDNLPYSQIDKHLSFRWDKLKSSEQDIGAVSSELSKIFPGQKIVLGDTTNFTGPVWTISKKDQFTPGELSRQVLDLMDGKLAGAKYNLSKEIPDIMGQGELKIVSNDISQHMQKYGLDPDIESTMTQRDNHFTWETPKGKVELSRKTTPDGNYEWTAYTIPFDKGSGEGGKFYQGLYDWIDSLGPQHKYTATSGLTAVNQYRATINQIKFGLRSGDFSNNINHNIVQTGMGKLKLGADSKIPGVVEGSGETFKTLSHNIVSYIENRASITLGKDVRLAEMTDSELNKLVGLWHSGEKGVKGNAASTGINTLKMMRAIAKNPSGASKGAMENFANRAEDVLDNMPQPLPPRTNY